MNRYEAKTVDEAIELACADKRIAKEEINYFVIEEKPGGIFGIGAKAIIEAYCNKDIEDFIFEYIRQYFENINMGCEILIESTDEGFDVKLNAENNAVIIGKAGQTLQAITNVVKGAASSKFKRHVNLLIDVNNYKEERYEKLKAMVGRIAKTVQKTKVSARLGQMTNDERKVIHQFLSTFSNIKTESEGEGNNRRLKIIYDSKKNN
ncbi:MAG: Jag N-terminal domain-containing protein [Bacillota bacterium]|jgi:spoIIIJ-associated protein|nr:Jag N-terminal domain-containing protein [Bacillota bacterium]NLL26425.1 KH domain-containing protein [Erysipelotrichia bacterium]